MEPARTVPAGGPRRLPWPGVGHVVAGRYRLTGHLASGTTGEVWAAEVDGTRVALKLLHRHLLRSDDVLSRLDEVLILTSQVEHPGVVRIVESDTRSQHPYVATVRLETRLLGGSDRPFLETATALADALAALHVAGVVHGDLRAGHVIGSAEGPRILDAGTSVVLGTLAVTPVTPPEVADGAPPDARSDTFALGVVLRTLAAEQPPAPDVADEVADVLSVATATEPEQRYAAGVALAEALRAIPLPS
ncbi:MAG: protein kinase [Actinobacteria bacterium]|nr:protein kinase [Actinomycetota bacterium]